MPGGAVPQHLRPANLNQAVRPDPALRRSGLWDRPFWARVRSEKSGAVWSCWGRVWLLWKI